MNVSVTRDARHYMRLTALGACLSLFFIFCHALGSKAEDEFKTVKIKRGDSISYISFKLYKKYNGMIADAIRVCNPTIKDLNRIYIGQEVKFPRLSYIVQGTYVAGQAVRMREKKPKTVMENEEQRKKKMEAFITYLTGAVEARPVGTAGWKPATINQELCEGDRIRTKKDSAVELITESNSIIRLSENSALEISKLQKNPERKTETAKFTFSLGRLWNKVKKLVNPKSEYTVSTPTALSGIRGTVYSIDVLPNRDTRFKTYSGAINVWNPSQRPTAGSPGGITPPTKVSGPTPVPGPHAVSMQEWTNIILTKHQELLVTTQGSAQQKAFDPVKDREDHWVKWNVERDEDLEKSEPWL